MFESMLERDIKESDRRHDIKTASIEDLKQNPHVQGLLETLKWIGEPHVGFSGIETPKLSSAMVTKARTKLKEWK